MRQLRVLCRNAVLIYAAFLSSALQAQITNVTNSTSTPIAGAGHDYFKMPAESVNPANGSVSVRISVPVPPGRRQTLPFAFGYDSASQYLGGSQTNGNGAWLGSQNLLSGGGWSYSVPQISRIFLTYTDPFLIKNFCNVATGYMYIDALGGRHSLYLSHMTDNPSSQACQDASSGAGWVNFNSQGPTTGGDPTVAATIYSYSTGSNAMQDGNDGSQKVADADGTVHTFINSSWSCHYLNTTNRVGLVSSVEDRNGNLFQFAASTFSSTYPNCPTGFTMTDALGRTVVSAPNFGQNGTTVSISGISQPYTTTWASVSYSGSAIGSTQVYSDSFCNGVPAWPAGPGSRITAITLPNGKQYTFSYDSTFGLLSKITYPNGGYVSYSWGINTNSDLASWTDSNGTSPGTCEFKHDTPAVIHRYVSFDGHTIALQQDFAYSTNWQPSANYWLTKTTTVSTHDLLRGITFQTVYTYQGRSGLTVPDERSDVINSIPVEQTVTYKDTAGNTLETVTKAWVDQYRLHCELHTLDNGLISGAFYTYGAGAKVTDKKEYDFGLITSTSVCQNSNSPPPSGITPTRETVTNYQSFANTPIYTFGPSIFDRPSSVITYDSSGTRAAETDYSYDQAAVSSLSSAPTGHDETNYSASYNNRGNATTITKQCFQGSTSCTNVVTTSTYDETGQLVSAIDPNGNTTQYSYADNYQTGSGTPPGNTNAYLTTITYPTVNGVTQHQYFQYAYSDGQLTQSQDDNDVAAGLSTSYQYADPLRRPTEADFPDGGYTKLSYTDTAPSPSVTKTTLIDSKVTPNVVESTTTVMDGVGHGVQIQLTSDPEGIDYTDSTYDGLGHLWKQSNPHRSSGLPTDGTTAYTYDALGRTTQVIQPDGSATNTSYSGNCKTVTDEIGNSRKSCSDALGTL